MTDATNSATTAGADVTRRYAAFISYCHADSKSAGALQRFLETYRLPRDVAGAETDRATLQTRLRPVFLDRADMPAGTDLRGEIDAALGASAALIVVCSPAAAKSRWVNLEIERFRQQHGDTRIFAVIIDGVAHASEHVASAEQECFPPALRLRDTPEGPVRADPAAVDLRRSGDGLQVGRLRLVAGLVGLPLDQLVHRDARRRHRRTLAVIIGLSLALAGTAALALYAIAARNEAQRQRFAAEGMIEFMIGDLRKTLEPMGRLSAMDPLGKKALDYYRQQDADALDANSLGRRARVLQLVGEIQDQRGNLDAALSNFETAAGTTGELLERTPDDPQRIFDHAQSVYWVGYIAYRRGRLESAESAFDEYLRLALKLVAIEPGNADYRAETGYAYSNLGTLLYGLGRNREAEAVFRKALAVSAVLSAANPGDLAARYDLAQSHAWVADSLSRQGEMAEAQRERDDEFSLLNAILTEDSSNQQARAALGNALVAQSRLAKARGELRLAMTLAEKAAGEWRTIARADPDNTDAAGFAAVAELAAADALLANGKPSAAEIALANVRHYRLVLDSRDRSVSRWKLVEAREFLLRGGVAAERRQWPAALRAANSALGILAILPANGRDDSDARYWRDCARMQAGQALAAMGDIDAANLRFVAVSNDTAIGKYDPEPRMAELRARAAAARLGLRGAEPARGDT